MAPGRDAVAPPKAASATRDAAPQARPTPQASYYVASMESDDDDAPRRRGGFALGFSIAAGLCLALILVYARHDAIARAAPQVAAPLQRYVAAVDAGRERVEALAAQVRAMIAEGG